MLLPFFTASMDGAASSSANLNDFELGSRGGGSAGAQALVNDTIVLCPCSDGEWLPMHPYYPADIFTSCLTTPLKIALRWFVRRNQVSMKGLNPEAVDHIPGETTDRTTPMGELNWIFAAVTDSIAWNVLPKALFQRLFRQDLMVASIFRNFLLADRILRTLGCTPVSYPPLPPGIAHHPLWKSWDMTCETMLVQLIRDGTLGNHLLETIKKAGTEAEESGSTVTELPPPAPLVTTVSGNSTTAASPFFSEHLRAFEVWLNFSEIHKLHLELGTLRPPEPLPIVLQVLLSQANRIRALQLLRRFLDLGPWAVNMSLSLGIFPYVMRLLQSPDYKSLLVSIWASILAFDPSCRNDMMKSKAFPHFVQHLMWGLNGSNDVSDAAKERTLAAFDIAVACHGYPAGQSECIGLSLHTSCCVLLSSYDQGENSDGTVELHLPSHFRLWLCLCIASVAESNRGTQKDVFAASAHTCLFSRLDDRDAEVRAAVCYALGCLVSSKQLSSANNSSTSLGASDSTQAFNRGSLIPQQQHNANIRTGHSPAFGQHGMGVQWQPQSFQGQVPPSISLQGQPFTGQTSFFGQRGPSSHANLQSELIQSPVSIQGQGLPSGFLVGTNPLVGSSVVPHLDTPGARSLRTSVFDDHQRLALDLACMEKLMMCTNDASVVVRYEATMAMANHVGKYVDAFAVVAASSDESGNDSTPALDLEERDRAYFANSWKALRSLQHHDPFPPVRRVAGEIVAFVFKNVLQSKMFEHEAPQLRGIDEEGSHGDLSLSHHLPTAHSGLRRGVSVPSKEQSELRRVSSEILSGGHGLSSLSTPSTVLDSYPMNQSLPKSSFFEWKKSSFDVNLRTYDSHEDQPIDALSPEGASRLYLGNRNHRVFTKAQHYSEKYLSLAPKPPAVRKGSIEEMLMINEGGDDALLAAEKEATKKKNDLQMSETRLLTNRGVDLTTMIRFHSFEDVLVATDSADSVTMWSTRTGEKFQDFSNGNPKKTRITSCNWIDEERSSLFLTGCDDGTVRLWSSLLEANGEPSRSSPRMMSAFRAAPMKAKVPQNGLVCEWQPSSQNLLAGGNTKEIHCWDLASEKKFNTLKTEKECNLTALCTAWDYDSVGTTSSQGRGYQGLGHETVVGGFSDGSMKIFDLRTAGQGTEFSTSPKFRRKRIMGYSEHESWIVSVAFAGYGGRYELISGTVSGEIKAWDLRMSSSTRTLEVQRSNMTCFAVHPKIPILATGSHTQFIKLLTLDGETMQVIRYHESTGMKSHRIGPVSCLAFHRYKPLLAAGAADPYIGLYSTRQTEAESD